MHLTTYEEFWINSPKDSFGFTNYYDRHEGIKRWGFAIPNAEAIKAVAELSPIVELGAGTGYWASLLAEAGAEVQAYDANVPGVESANTYGFGKSPLYFKVEQGTEDVLAGLTARALLLVWPCFNTPFANDCLKQFTGEYVAFVGEYRGGCTANDDFFDALADHWEEVRCVRIPQWGGIHDSLRIYRRKP